MTDAVKAALEAQTASLSSAAPDDAGTTIACALCGSRRSSSGRGLVPLRGVSDESRFAYACENCSRDNREAISRAGWAATQQTRYPLPSEQQRLTSSSSADE
jgi:hypothetical protein